jgi:hypothetical protein
MRRIKLIAGVAIPLLAVSLGSMPAMAAAPVPGPPISVHASSVAGSRVTVSWSAPVSDGGSAIKYYVATTYAGNHFCTSSQPGSGSCDIVGLKVGSVRPTIRVRAVNANGPGPVVVSRVTHDTGTTGTTAPATSPASPSPTTPVATTSSTSSHAAGTSTTAALTKLPFTGIDLEAPLIVGVILTVSGLVLMSPIGRRRTTRWSSADRLLQAVSIEEGAVAS